MEESISEEYEVAEQYSGVKLLVWGHITEDGSVQICAKLVADKVYGE